jgi:glucose/arabinose dehydrogenase
VSAVNRILRLDGIEQRLDQPPQPAVVSDAFPTDGHHGRKFIAFGLDGKLYVPVGAPCNVCEPDPERHGIITRMNPDGGGREIVARGVRNSVGFAWHPGTGDLWFTDNGRDSLGDDIPPDELNRVTKPGQNFGYPYCHGGTIPDPEFGSRRVSSESGVAASIRASIVSSAAGKASAAATFGVPASNRCGIAAQVAASIVTLSIISPPTSTGSSRSSASAAPTRKPRPIGP